MYNIPVLEYYPLHKDVPSLNVWSQQMNATTHAQQHEIEHGYYVLRHLQEGLRTYLTDDEIMEHIQIKYMKKGIFAIKHALAIGAKACNLSSMWLDYDVNAFAMKEQEEAFRLENELAKTCLMFAGAGNDGNDPYDHDEGQAATREAWLGIGAVSSEYRYRTYSSWGNGAVDFCGIDGLVDNKLGTSFAVAWFTGVVTSYEVKHFLMTGTYPKRAQTLAWIKKHTIDILDNGIDLKSGLGVLEPPQTFRLYTTEYEWKSHKKFIKVWDGYRWHRYSTDKLINYKITKPGTITAWADKTNKLNRLSYPV